MGGGKLPERPWNRLLIPLLKQLRQEVLAVIAGKFATKVKLKICIIFKLFTITIQALVVKKAQIKNGLKKRQLI